MLFLAVLIALVVVPAVVAALVVRLRGLTAPRSATPFWWATLPGLALAAVLQVLSLDVEGMAVLGYGYAILASLTGAVLSGTIALVLAIIGRRRAGGTADAPVDAQRLSERRPRGT